ncbi:NAD(P)-binding protein [Thozetella sp. PMI_491]|nr:NAD(P)-binding protein [Thozetella sp. PMI_491]
MVPLVSIIFGPTGRVGSAAALRAHELGAKVVLALRDTTKAIPGLSQEKEQAGTYERVQADVNDTESVIDAVQKTGAKHAFIYHVHGSRDHMRSAVEALKVAGIEFLVFLSSAVVQGDIRKIEKTSIIPYAHAQVEIAIDETFGPNGYVSLRPGYFATNTSWWIGMVRKGIVRVPYPDGTWDWISPEDIGKAAGTVLVQGIAATESAEDRNVIFLAGPKLLSTREAVAICAKVLGREVEVIEVGEEEGAAEYVKCGAPAWAAADVVWRTGNRFRGNLTNEDAMYTPGGHDGPAANLAKHAGKATQLEVWAAQNKTFLNG